MGNEIQRVRQDKFTPSIVAAYLHTKHGDTRLKLEADRILAFLFAHSDAIRKREGAFDTFMNMSVAFADKMTRAGQTTPIPNALLVWREFNGVHREPGTSTHKRMDQFKRKLDEDMNKQSDDGSEDARREQRDFTMTFNKKFQLNSSTKVKRKRR